MAYKIVGVQRHISTPRISPLVFLENTVGGASLA